MLNSTVDPVPIPSSRIRYPVTPPLSPRIINSRSKPRSHPPSSAYSSVSSYAVDDEDNMTYEDYFRSRKSMSTASRAVDALSSSSYRTPSNSPPSRYTTADTPPSSPSSKPKVHFSTRNYSVRRRSTPQSPVSHSFMDVGAAWGILFDENGQPTRRLDQILTALATHMINEFEPRYSLVISPAKISRLLDRFPSSGDISDLPQAKYSRDHDYITDLFHSSSRTSAEALETMYQQLRCEHYLIPSPHSASNPPRIPSLTAVGFTRFMTLLIRAFPDQEAVRWKAIMATLPLSLPSSSPNRAEDGGVQLPSKFPRRLFPPARDDRSYSAIKSVVAELQRQQRAENKARPRVIQDHSRHRHGNSEREPAAASPPWYVRSLAKLSGGNGQRSASPPRRGDQYSRDRDSRESRDRRRADDRYRDRGRDKSRQYL